MHLAETTNNQEPMSDSQNYEPRSTKQKPTTNEEPLSKKEAFLNTAPSTEEHEDNPDAVIENNKKPKKRPGLSQGLTPSKKAMKFHEKVYNNS